MQTALRRVGRSAALGARTYRPAAQRLCVTRASSSASSSPPAAAQPWQIRMLYDGECALCKREVDFLRGRDADKGHIDFVDIASPGYSPQDNAGVTFDQAMERIHAVLPDGRVVKDIEVFRRLYEAVGLGLVYAITANPTVEKLANQVYGVWAQYRTQITGREAMQVILERRRQAAASATGQLPGSMCGDADTECELPTAPAKRP